MSLIFSVLETAFAAWANFWIPWFLHVGSEEARKLYQCPLPRLHPQIFRILLDGAMLLWYYAKYFDALREIYKFPRIDPQFLKFSPKIYDCFIAPYFFAIPRINPKWCLNKDIWSLLKPIYPSLLPSCTRWAFFLPVRWKFPLHHIWYLPFQWLCHLNSMVSSLSGLVLGT